MKKTLTTFLLTFLFSAALAQQPAKPVSADVAFSNAINKVVLDFTFNFSNIQGSKMPAEVDADTYTSKACVPGALVCKIMRYHSVEDKSANWQAVVYSGENYAEALKAYKKVFSQVKKTTVKGIDGGTFEGRMDAVDENVGFAVAPLRIKTKDKRYKSLVAEVEITNNYTGWEVFLNIYTKKIVEEEEEQAQ